MSERSTLAVVVPAYNEQEQITELLDGLYRQQNTETKSHIIVDNGSTDETRQRIQAWRKLHEGFPLSVIEESEKGTGKACRTGFECAIARGSTTVARTDADCRPFVDWTAKINHTFNAQHQTEMVGGRVVAKRDADYRRGDDLILWGGITGARMFLSLKHGEDLRRIAVGGNMAVSAKAYEAVGGFSPTSIDTTDEDAEFSRSIIRRFGREAVTIDNSLRVATSMRRFRKFGLHGLILHHGFPELRARSKRTIDIR